MGKLVLHLPDGTVQDIVLGKERLTIGRRSDNDVCLPYPAVSSEHAAVVTVLNDSFLEDLGSTNGTLVNGKRVLKHLLRDLDQVDIGRQRLVYYVNEAAQAEPLPPDVLLRDLEGLRDQVARVRNRKSDAVRRERLPEPPEDDEILAELEQSAAPAGAERAVPAAAEVAARGPATRPRRMEPSAPPGARAAAEGPPRARAVPEGPARSPHVGEAPRPLPLLDDQPAARRVPAIKGEGVGAHGLATPATPRREPAAAESGPASAEARIAATPARSAPTLWVRVLTGPSAGRELPLDRDEFWLGQVGLQVAKLARRDGAWTLVPVEGSETPRLNGAAVSAEGAFVAPGDRFVIAGAQIEVERR